MAILHLVRCDSCGKDTPMQVSVSSWTMTARTGGQSIPLPQASDYSIPPSIKQVGGQHFCSWPCVGRFAAQQGAEGA